MKKKKKKKHPPHPHAHLSQDGFYVEEKKPDNIKPLCFYDSFEGLHLDPTTRTTLNPKKGEENKYLVIDPEKWKKKKQVKELYIDRLIHSQFEESESAIMALAYALNCQAGQSALEGLLGSLKLNVGTKYDRTVIYSRTAVYGLSLESKTTVSTSSHPLANQPIQMIERGPGKAGKAKLERFSIGRVVTVLDNDGSGNLVLVTHYPTQKDGQPRDCIVNVKPLLPVNVDYVEHTQMGKKKEFFWSHYKANDPITPGNW